ncbi:MAG: hypothetical protein E7311_04565 [Clostridiales bacterium]|nr:hypothetical protein [Clostridiales bacterium]
MRRIKQNFYPEGYFEVIRIENMSVEEIEEITGKNVVVSGRVIAYIADDTSNYLKIDMGNGRIGIIYTENDEDIYKNKSLVNEVINFRIKTKNENNEYILERNSLINKARNEILQNIKIGDIIKSKIVAFLGYGVFVDIGWGATALLYKTDIIGNPSHPKEVLKNTTFLDVEIKNISDDGNIYVKMIENG